MNISRILYGLRIIHNQRNDITMTIAKNIEVSSTSETSFEDAIQKGIARIAKTVSNVQGAWVKEQKVGITDGKISKYHVIMIVSFVINDDSDISQLLTLEPVDNM